MRAVLTLQQILDVKKDIKKIMPVIESLSTVWPSNKLTMVRVLVQNLCFFSESSINCPSLDEEYEHMQDILKALEKIAQFDPNDHTIGWINEEVNMAWTGYWMSLEGVLWE